MKRRGWIALVVAAGTVAITAQFVFAPIAILYHRHFLLVADRRLESCSKAQISGEPIDASMQSKWFARRMHHCDRLVALGYFFHASYELNHLPSSSFQAYQHAILMRGSACPQSPDRRWTVGVRGDHFVIDVYDCPEFKSQWDKFAEGINDPEITNQPHD